MKNLYLSLATGLIVIFLPLSSFSQTLIGSVYHAKKGLPLSGVVIQIEGTALSAVTDQNGRFFLDQLPEGKSELIFSKTGYVTKQDGIEYDRGQDTISIGLSMCPMNTSYDYDRQGIAWRQIRTTQQTPQAVGALDQSQIRELPARNLPEALLGLPAGAWIQNGFTGSSPQIRGLSGRYVPLLEDNIPILPVTIDDDPSAWWLTIDPVSISRAEVMRGGSATIYGNGALGGIISIDQEDIPFTSGKPQLHGEAATRLQPGSAELGGNAGLRVSADGISASLSGYRRQFGPMRLAAISQVAQPAGYGTAGYRSRLNIRLSPNQLLEIGYEHHEVEGDTAGAGNLPWTLQELDRQQLFTKWTGHFEEVWWNEISLTAAKQDFSQDRLYSSGINEMPVREVEDLQTIRALLQIKSTPLFLWNVVSGVEVARHEVGSQAWIQPEDGSNEPTLPSLPNGATQEEIGLFSLHTVDILKLRLAFGGRAMAHRVNWEDPRWGSATWTPQALTGNISAMYALTRNVDITSSFRTGVRAPGLSDLRGGLPFQQMVSIPSDSLASERSFSSEIGLKATNKYFTGSLVFYHSQLNDWMRQIATTYQGNPMWQGFAVQQRINLDQAFVQGVEAEVEVPVTKATAIYGSFTYTYGLNVSQSDFLSAIPPINSRLGLRVSPGEGFWSRLEWRHASNQDQLSVQDLLEPSQDPDGTPGWNVVHLHMGYDFQWGYVMLGIENVFDARYMYHGSSIESPGRLLIFSMQIGF